MFILYDVTIWFKALSEHCFFQEIGQRYSQTDLFCLTVCYNFLIVSVIKNTLYSTVCNTLNDEFENNIFCFEHFEVSCSVSKIFFLKIRIYTFSTFDVIQCSVPKQGFELEVIFIWKIVEHFHLQLKSNKQTEEIKLPNSSHHISGGGVGGGLMQSSLIINFVVPIPPLPIFGKQLQTTSWFIRFLFQ